MSFYQENYNLDKNIILRTLLLGRYGVGKTSIIQKLIFNKFESIYNSTIGVDFSVKHFTYKNLDIKLHLWDTAGQERFRAITKSFYKNNSIYILVFDLSDYNSFIELDYYINDIQKNTSNDKCSYFLIGTKSDLIKDTKITNDIILNFSKQNNIVKYYEVSSKNNNLKIIFEDMIKNTIDQNNISTQNINYINIDDESNVSGCC